MALVKEYIAQEFTRGGEPLKQMSIGQTELDKKFIEETDWGLDLDQFYIMDFIRNWKDWPILVVKQDINGIFIGYIAATVNHIMSSSSPTPDQAISKLKGKISWYMEKNPAEKAYHKKMHETQEFTREGTPLEKMGIGQKVQALLVQFMKDFNGRRMKKTETSYGTWTNGS